jgi:hypothetical protein
MEVTAVAHEWPERQFRQRSWLPLRNAVSSLTDRGLRALVNTVLVEERHNMSRRRSS